MSLDLELREARAQLAHTEQFLLAIAGGPGVNRPSSSNSDACSALSDVRDAIDHIDKAIDSLPRPKLSR